MRYGDCTTMTTPADCSPTAVTCLLWTFYSFTTIANSGPRNIRPRIPAQQQQNSDGSIFIRPKFAIVSLCP